MLSVEVSGHNRKNQLADIALHAPNQFEHNHCYGKYQLVFPDFHFGLRKTLHGWLFYFYDKDTIKDTVIRKKIKLLFA